ncbi:nucleolar protein 58-like [Montipora foliosa]|uniref:nucleolar protein 58-like n=1 Tax=Montipora foliosa TaxID=591990 RepID=UPI0035F13AE7
MPSSKRALRTECPVGFEPVIFNDSGDYPVVEDDNNSSLWLIKVPLDFDVSSLSGQEVILNGSHELPATCISRGHQDKKYEVHSKEIGTTELSSYTVLLPSSKRKTLRAASTIKGQMSVLQSLSIPPAILPDPCDYTAVPRQTHSRYIKKWEPFGCRDPYRMSQQKKTDKDMEECLDDSSDGAKKSKKKKKKGNMEETASKVSGKSTEPSQTKKKKKKTDKEKNEFDITRVKIEPGLDSESSEIETESPSRKSRNGGFDDSDNNKRRDDLNRVCTKKKRKADKGEFLDNVEVKREAGTDESLPKRRRKERQNGVDVRAVKSVDEQGDSKLSGFGVCRVENKPRETPKKSKKNRK